MSATKNFRRERSGGLTASPFRLVEKLLYEMKIHTEEAIAGAWLKHVQKAAQA
jgi:hypothetical protein